MTASHVILANFGNGQCVYANVDDTWYSANVDGFEVVDVRWKATPHEIKQIRTMIAEHPSVGAYNRNAIP